MGRVIVDLSFPIHEGMTTFPVYWHPMVEISQLGRIGIEGRESRKLVLGTHTGTHVDAPRHFVAGAPTIDKLPLDLFIGPATVVDFSWAQPLQEMQVADLEAVLGDRKLDRLLIRFDWSDQWNSTRYYTEHPYLADDAAYWIVNHGVRLLGMDTPQADSPNNGRNSSRDSPVHKILLGAGVVKLEYLTNLRSLKSRDVDLIALPLNIRDGDGSPVRCIALENT
jgi:arylformamidase